ncbi:Fe-S cluster assembly protein SufD [Paenibacillus thermoaerophilus]|uniref:Fe-S cluster assembly protein SufD n=1 Tax=Paenibacillus thermoaerophilus TaxID=1215385 RepID=A0ABW2UYS5_9BACL|nr:Fe-S cluster assembly protein SufD [Paenibacillus thermoaerophilus]TMV16051.1 Fe-S cluster assembly protein SufD [Paenibacillus thermoaerophilus]
MSTQVKLPISRDELEGLAHTRKEPAWLSAGRADAVALAEKLDLPKLEKTRLDRWNLDAYGVYVAPKTVTSAAELPEAIRDLLPSEGQAAGLIVQRNSGAVFRTVSEALAKQGVIFTDLETAARDHEELVKPHLHSVVKTDENRLTALHAALWNGGVFLYVPANVTVELPLQALFYADNASETFAPHVLIVAEANSTVTYVENVLTTGLQAPLVASAVLEVVAKPGATVRIASVNNLEESAIGVSYRRAELANDARVEWTLGELNNGNAVADTATILLGNGSSSDSKGISVGSGSQKMDITTRAVHWGKMTPSEMITRAVMREEATAIINGITKIEKGATGANGQQTEKVLMLSPNARGDANPILLIDEDDVKAGHSASVGQVNPEQVYYLMSRGIPRAEAERLIIYGFLSPVIEDVPLENVRNQLQTLVERKLSR